MDAFTRREALGYALVQYATLCQRALREADDAGRAYIEGLYESWDVELRRLARFGRSITVTDEVMDSLLRLSARASSDDVHPDALIGWVDMYPESVANMFPPSASTFCLELGDVPCADVTHEVGAGRAERETLAA